jgi:hypothetical protein
MEKERFDLNIIPDNKLMISVLRAKSAYLVADKHAQDEYGVHTCLNDYLEKMNTSFVR